MFRQKTSVLSTPPAPQTPPVPGSGTYWCSFGHGGTKRGHPPGQGIVGNYFQHEKRTN